MATDRSPLLERPLYVFDLPEELLATLTLKESTSPVQHFQEEQLQRTKSVNATDSGEASPAKATACNLCGLSFTNVQEQRNHIRSDLHAFNIKQKQRGLKPVNETDFERLIGDLDESLSGSESSGSDDGDDDGGHPAAGQSNLSHLLEKQARIAGDEGDDGADEVSSKKRARGAGTPPIVWFSSSALPKNTSLGIYRAIFPPRNQGDGDQSANIIRQMQLAPKKAPNSSTKPGDGGVPLPGTDIGSHYFLCMIGGGHFAAMIIALTPKTGKKQGGATERSATVVAHKTFHRYTTRRKQGGAQSANDNSKGNAHSAGSSLRRYNEAALVNEVRDLLTQWKSMIDSADLIFVRATGNTNRQTLFGPYEGQVLRHNDSRNRGFPFSTRRATQAELMRCFVELTRVKVSEVDEAALAAAAAAEAERREKEEQSKNATSKKAGGGKPSKSKDDEVAELHTSQIIPLIRRSKVPALLSYLSSNTIPSSFEFFPPSSQQHHHAPTPLHLAASVNSAVSVSALLLKGGADPTRPNGDDKTAFELAGDRATRDAFRVARHELGEDRWDWQSALVPAPLSRAEADKRAAREKDEQVAEAAAESARRKAETERLRAESRREEVEKKEKRLGKGKTLSGVPEKSAVERREEEARGMTPEMRQRLERERRARAAEDRIRRMQQG